MNRSAIRVDVDQDVAIVTLNRPERLNAVNADVRRGLIGALATANADDAIRAVVITGAGRAFCAGQDLEEAAGIDWRGLVPWQRETQAMYQAVRDLDKPCIAAINGVAAGAGFQIGLCADWRIAVAGTRIGQPEVAAGLASIVGSYLMTLHVGHTHNLQMSLSGELLDTRRAWEIGLITEVVEADVLAAALARARKLAALPPLPIRLSKQRFRAMTQAGFDEACIVGIRSQLECYANGVPQQVMHRFLASRGRLAGSDGRNGRGDAAIPASRSGSVSAGPSGAAPATRCDDAARRMLARAESTAMSLTTGFPHWADGGSGRWTTTPDGDWTGGALPGMLWIGQRLSGGAELRALARRWCERLRPRAGLQTAFKGFGFYYGAALGERLAADAEAAALALTAAESLAGQFDARLDLIPLGRDAEEAGDTGSAFSSIDSLQAVPLLQWASRHTGDPKYGELAARHATRVLNIHCRADGSIIQSSELDPADGRPIRHFTHKGFSDRSVWGRAQAWGMVYAALAYGCDRRRADWLGHATAAADWWLDHVPPSMIAHWDFDDPAIPAAPTDTAATAIACAALLKLSVLAADEARRGRYRDAAERTAQALVEIHLTPDGRLTGGCFNRREDSRAQDSAENAELIFGSYYLLESLLVLAGRIGAVEV